MWVGETWEQALKCLRDSQADMSPHVYMGALISAIRQCIMPLGVAGLITHQAREGSLIYVFGTSRKLAFAQGGCADGAHC